MAEDFEKLAADWENHPVGLIAEIDCTSDLGQPICEDFEVQVNMICKEKKRREKIVMIFFCHDFSCRYVLTLLLLTTSPAFYLVNRFDFFCENVL